LGQPIYRYLYSHPGWEQNLRKTHKGPGTSHKQKKQQQKKKNLLCLLEPRSTLTIFLAYSIVRLFEDRPMEGGGSMALEL
jgi:hypothetical protein